MLSAPSQPEQSERYEQDEGSHDIDIERSAQRPLSVAVSQRREDGGFSGDRCVHHLESRLLENHRPRNPPIGRDGVQQKKYRETEYQSSANSEPAMMEFFRRNFRMSLVFAFVIRNPRCFTFLDEARPQCQERKELSRFRNKSARHAVTVRR